MQPYIFFFSSRRRHTRYWRDWSSDVCSSDLHFNLRHFFRWHGDLAKRRWHDARVQIGRASCRERVLISDVADSLEKNDNQDKNDNQEAEKEADDDGCGVLANASRNCTMLLHI